MKIGVLFNCQANGLAQSLRVLRPGDDVIAFTFPQLMASQERQAEAAAALLRCDVALSAQPKFKLGPAEPARLREAGLRVVALPPVLFSGFHPDITHPGPRVENEPRRGGQFEGPTGLIHSRLAIAGFLGGLTPGETAQLYNRLVFARLGYLDRFDEERQILLESYRRLGGVDLAPWFAEWVRSGCFMHTDNHPKAHVLHDVARIACRVMDLPVTGDPDAAPPPDTLAHMPHHPVYDDIAQYLHVPANACFRLPKSPAAPARTATLDAFLGLCWQAFATVPTGKLMGVEGIEDTLRSLNLAMKSKEGVLF